MSQQNSTDKVLLSEISDLASVNSEWWLKLQETVDMFLFLAVELTVLFLVISYLVGLVLEYLSAEKIQRILGAKHGKGYLSAAILGSVTPFCSCSTIPMLIGLLKARAGFGPTMTFLFASPLLNPVILGLFVITFGVKMTITYASASVILAVLGGVLMAKLGFERYIRSPVISGAAQRTSCCTTNSASIVQKNKIHDIAASCGDSQVDRCENQTGCCDSQVSRCNSQTGHQAQIEASCCDTVSIAKKYEPSVWLKVWQETWAQFLQVQPYLALGITIGSITYGFMPSELIVQYAGADSILAIPVAAVIGVPLYISAEVMIPLSGVLMDKGMAPGSIIALIIGSAGASLTEVFLLRSIFKAPVITAFLVMVFSMAVVSGLMFSVMF